MNAAVFVQNDTTLRYRDLPSRVFFCCGDILLDDRIRVWIHLVIIFAIGFRFLLMIKKSIPRSNITTTAILILLELKKSIVYGVPAPSRV